MNGSDALKRISDTAMILAAGLGTRMRPLTLIKPKPLFEVGGRTMLDHAIDKLKEVGIQRVVVNTFYLAEQIESHVAQRKDIEIVISRETEILDTGGGIKNAISYFGGKPFFSLNADLPWFDGAKASLLEMAESWDPGRMDVLLLLKATKLARGFLFKGDFIMETDGQVWRKEAPEPRPYVWISAQILKPQLFSEVQKKVFSNNTIFDLAEARSKLFGTLHRGTCYHVGTPADLEEANRLLANGTGWAVKP